MNGCVQTFDVWCRGTQSTTDQLQLCDLSGPTFGFTTQNFSMVGGYTENLENHKTVKIGGWTLARVWVLARDNTVRIYSLVPRPANFYVKWCQVDAWRCSTSSLYHRHVCSYNSLFIATRKWTSSSLGNAACALKAVQSCTKVMRTSCWWHKSMQCS